MLFDVARFTPVVVYFYLYWTPKELLRRAFRTGALGFLSLSAVLLWVEVAVEFGKHHGLHLVVPSGSWQLQWAFLVAFTIAVLGLLRHHRRERSHRHSEFLLGERVWEFLITRDADTWDKCITRTLPLFYDVFRKYKVRHLSIALPDGETLRIHPAHVYPPEADPSYYPALPINGGVAGLVFGDGHPRYVPRLFFPTNGRKRWPLQIFFPHAMIFEIKKVAGKRIDIVRPRLNLDAFKTNGVSEFKFKSFISVPLKPIGYSECIGVLNIDFMSTDPLDRIHVKTAVFLGVILADELRRIRESGASPSK